MKEHHIFAENIDPKALTQFYEAMKMDYVVKGALMPDAHVGYALPIGSAVATDGVIVPAWVGYDIGCTDGDTEYLTPLGWKKIKDFNQGDAILVYNAETQKCHYGFPRRYIVNTNCEGFYHLDNGVVDQMLTEDHKVPLFSSKNPVIQRDAFLKDWLTKNKELKKGVNQRFKTTIDLIQNKDAYPIEKSDSEIKLLIAISADGCIRKSGKVEFHLKKQRKIERLQEILKDLSIQYNIYDTKDDTWGCSFQYPEATKRLLWIYGCTPEKLQVVSEELSLWDGHIRTGLGTMQFSTTVKENADAAQYAFSCSGYRTNIHTVHYEQENWNDIYQVYTTKNAMVDFPAEKDITFVPSTDGKSYCFTTDTGYWVMRRGGKIAITGNCGMCALQLHGVTPEDIVANQDAIFDEIYKTIPMGYRINQRPVWEIPMSTDRLTDEAAKIALDKSYDLACGSLGSGNHFIEIGNDDNDNVWIIIHSGSRGVGHDIAEYYIKLADPMGKARDGNYGFSVYSEQGQAYLQDQNWLLEYALFNRETMMTRVVAAINKSGLKSSFYWNTLINRNHNHVVPKDGMWIHRKGATHAEDGMYGVIPGNMHDGSFIVRGKGNPDALWSSSHGAGRVLGRRQAKEKLDMDEFQRRMTGIKAKVDNSTLDESPMAYKDVYEVMRLQEPLVEVITHVTPLINIKA